MRNYKGMKEQEKPARKVKDVSNAPKSAREIFAEQISSGLAEHQRSFKGLLLSALAAGMEVGFTLFLVGVLYTRFHQLLHPAYLHLMMAFAYPAGFIMVIIGRSELFTEHTTLAVIPVLNRSATVRSLFQVWGTVYLGNLLGGYFVAVVLTLLGAGMGIISIEAFYEIAHNLVKYDWGVTLGSSILAGWLMGLLSWLVSSAQETISRVFMVFLVTSLIGVGGLHHSIVGSIEVFAGLLVTSIAMGDYLHFQLWATLGNVLGGVVFVSILKYSTVRFNK